MAMRNMFIELEPLIRLHLDYLNQLIYCTFPRKQWLKERTKSKLNEFHNHSLLASI